MSLNSKPTNQPPEDREEWKSKFEHWLIHNLQFTSKSNVERIIDHVEKYIRPTASSATVIQPSGMQEMDGPFEYWVTKSWPENNNESAGCRGAARYAFEWVTDYLKKKSISQPTPPPQPLGIGVGQPPVSGKEVDESEIILLSNLCFGYSEWAKKQPKETEASDPNDDPLSYLYGEGFSTVKKLSLGLSEDSVDDWISVEDVLPDDDVVVLCYHSFSNNYFVCYRTKDCSTGEEKWFTGAKPTHWQKLTTPKNKHIKNENQY